MNAEIFVNLIVKAATDPLVSSITFIFKEEVIVLDPVAKGTKGAKNTILKASPNQILHPAKITVNPKGKRINT